MSGRTRREPENSVSRHSKTQPEHDKERGGGGNRQFEIRVEFDKLQPGIEIKCEMNLNQKWNQINLYFNKSMEKIVYI